MKRIDKFLISSFLPPFVVTFFIALFVLIMQFLWVYIDDIIGKGVGLFLLIELIFYLSISLFPMALPIAVLISSVMVVGNMAEHYELSSFKSAGVPLLRVMAPLMVICGGIAVFSFFCSNNFIPIANLKFKSRLYDIRKQKPTLSLEEGVFNDDFQGTVIHIGNKLSDNKTIENVKLYDHENSTKGIGSEIIASKGEMYTTSDKRYFVMNLYEGTQYQEPEVSSSNKNQKPYIRTSFKEFNKVYDLGEFNLSRTNEDLFKSHETMLSIAQLSNSIDSIDSKTTVRRNNLRDQFDRHFILYKERVQEDAPSEEEEEMKEKYGKQDTSTVELNIKAPQDSTPQIRPLQDTSTFVKKNNAKRNVKLQISRPEIENDTILTKINQKAKDLLSNQDPVKNKRLGKKGKPKTPLDQVGLDRLDTLSSFTQTIIPPQRKKVYTRTLAHARSLNSQIYSTVRFLSKEKESRVKRVYELWTKFSMSLVCLIFLFIGAPMGAIVRKGGFGYPILIAILFFMQYIVLTIACKKLALNFTLPPILAAWMPCIILFPLGLILTYRAMNDSKMVNMDRYLNILRRVGSLFGMGG